MRRSKMLNRFVVALVVPAMFVCFTAQSTVAAMVATERVVAASDGAAARARVDTFLDREDVRQVLERYGVDASEAKARASALTDAEATDLAARLDAMPAGGNTVGIIIGAILLVFFVLLITDLLGLTNVFPFINKNRR